MQEGISGRGELWKEGAYLCTVHYEIDTTPDDPADTFTLTDGLLEVDEEEAQEPRVRAALEPHESFELLLAEPLADGRDRLSILIEPYEGHRPDERYQIRLRE